MSQRELILPDLGIENQPITASAWLVKRGSRVGEGEPLLEVLCGPATVDLPSPAGGKLMDKLVATDEILHVGQRLAVIEEEW
jgi:pyruvate/2-oxoglutarate dehydrogenase complex dihydrolipoamide acyltransferase (E2) component